MSIAQFPMREQPDHPSPARAAQLRERADALDAFPQRSDQHRAAQCMDNPTVYELQQEQTWQAGIVADALACAVKQVTVAKDLSVREQGAIRGAALEAIRTLSKAWRGYAVEIATSAVFSLLQEEHLLDSLVLHRRHPEKFRELCAVIGRTAVVAASGALQDETPSLGVYLRAYAEDVEAGR